MEENKKPDNPIAFPAELETGSRFKYFEQGMTLRDYFTAKAMNGLDLLAWNIRQLDELAERSYKIADAMLKQREL